MSIEKIQMSGGVSSEDETKYLELDFKHILKKIVALWDTYEVEVYMDSILQPGRKDSQLNKTVISDSSKHDIIILTERRQDQGLPFDVMLEIGDLLTIHRLKYQEASTCSWDISGVFDKKGLTKDIKDKTNDNSTIKK